MKEKLNNEEKVYAVGFKGFDPEMKCRDKQYAENEFFEEATAEICNSGMHFCKNPLDVLDYYPLLDNDCKLNEFATVEALAEPKTEGNKSVTTKLKIGTSLGLKGFIDAAVGFSLDWLKKVEYNIQAASQLASSGFHSKLASSGDECSVESTGKECVIAATGRSCKVKGALGCFIACAEWVKGDDCVWYPVAFKAAKVDGKKIKADTWYTVKAGEFVEV